MTSCRPNALLRSILRSSNSDSQREEDSRCPELNIIVSPCTCRGTAPPLLFRTLDHYYCSLDVLNPVVSSTSIPCHHLRTLDFHFSPRPRQIVVDLAVVVFRERGFVLATNRKKQETKRHFHFWIFLNSIKTASIGRARRDKRSRFWLFVPARVQKTTSKWWRTNPFSACS